MEKPYFKLKSNDPRVQAVASQIKGHTNIYTLFLALAMKNLVPQGRACFIVPHSFCSGFYFSALRQELIEETLPLAVHLFESRQDTFKADTVLQENVIFTFCRRKISSRHVSLSTSLNIIASKNAVDLHIAPLGRKVLLKHFLGRREGTLFFRLPTGELDERILETVDGWCIPKM